MRSWVIGLSIVGLGTVVGCGESSSSDSNEGEAGEAGAGSAGESSTGGSVTGGRGGTSGAGGTSGEGGTSGTSPTGGNAGDPAGGAAGESQGGAGGSPECTDEDCEEGQSCYPELGCATVCTTTDAILITTEAELAAFAALGCEVLDGSLTIRSPTLTNVDALGQPSVLRVITKDLAIDQSPTLENIQGFLGLETIGGSLVVTSSYLENLSGLESVRFIGSNSVANALVIVGNERLSNVTALADLTRLLTSVSVSANTALTSLSGLGKLRATSSVTIVNNPALLEVGGLADLEECDGFTVASNPAIATLSLPGLVTAGSLTITANPDLETIGLPELTTVENLTVAGNDSLTSMGTLDSLLSVGMLVIAGNPMLPQCFVDELDQRLMACNMSCGGNDMTATCN